MLLLGGLYLLDEAEKVNAPDGGEVCWGGVFRAHGLVNDFAMPGSQGTVWVLAEGGGAIQGQTLAGRERRNGIGP